MFRLDFGKKYVGVENGRYWSIPASVPVDSEDTFPTGRTGRTQVIWRAQRGGGCTTVLAKPAVWIRCGVKSVPLRGEYRCLRHMVPVGVP